MKMSSIFKKGMGVAALSLALLASQASAATLSYTNGDLLVGFTSTDPLKTNEYVLDIGTIAGLTQGLIGNVGADLASVFGASWFSDSTIKWGAFSGDTSTGNLWATKGADANTIKKKTASIQNGIANNINLTGSTVNGDTTGTSTLENAIQDKGTIGGFTNKAPYSILGSTLVAGLANSLDFYFLQANGTTTGVAGTKLNTGIGFWLDSQGNLNYGTGTTSVPDAGSTLCLLGLAMMGVAIFRNRLGMIENKI